MKKKRCDKIVRLIRLNINKNKIKEVILTAIVIVIIIIIIIISNISNIRKIK